MKKTILVGLLSIIQIASLAEEPLTLTWGQPSTENRSAMATPSSAVLSSTWTGDENFPTVGSVENDGITYTTFESASDAVQADVSFSFAPADGLAFTPSEVSFDIMKFASNNCYATISVEYGDGTIETLATFSEQSDIPRDNHEIESIRGNRHKTYSLNTQKATGNVMRLIINLNVAKNYKKVGLANVTISGTVEEAEFYTINVAPNDPTYGVVTTNQQKVIKGEWVTLTAKANDGYYFESWRDNDDNSVVKSTKKIYHFLPFSDVNYTANFVDVNMALGKEPVIKMELDNETGEINVIEGDIIMDGVVYRIHLGTCAVHYVEGVPWDVTIYGGYFEAIVYYDEVSENVHLLDKFVHKGTVGNGLNTDFSIEWTNTTIPIKFLEDEVVFPVTDYADDLFRGRKYLESVSLPSAFTKIPDDFFSGCTSLHNVVIPSTVTSIGESAFAGCDLSSTDFLSENIRTIGYGAFRGNLHLTTIIIPEGITTIEPTTFCQCLSLETIEFPSSLTTIGESAFLVAGDFVRSNLKTIRIPANVETIDHDAFSGHLLDAVVVDGSNPCTIASDAFAYEYFSRADRISLYVPQGSKERYAAADVWKDFKDITERGDLVISESGICTYCSPVVSDFSKVSGLSAYVASSYDSNEGKLYLSRVTKVPANTGIIVIGASGQYNVYREAVGENVAANLLKGLVTSSYIDPVEGENTNYILANGSHGIGFYAILGGGWIGTGKAYLQLPTATAPVRGLTLQFEDGEATGIMDVDMDTTASDLYFDLQGRRVTQPTQKGLYIVSGKKVFVRK